MALRLEGSEGLRNISVERKIKRPRLGCQHQRSVPLQFVLLNLLTLLSIYENIIRIPKCNNMIVRVNANFVAKNQRTQNELCAIELSL